MRVLITLLFLSISSSILSNDTLRIATYPRHIQFYSTLGPSFSEVQLAHPDIEQDMIFKPNPQPQWGFGFTYSWLSLGFSFDLPYTDESIDKYGRTEKFDFEAHYTMRKFFVDLTLKAYKGFYLSDPKNYISSWSLNDPYPKAQNLQTVSMATSFAYIFNPDKYSSNAAYTFSKAMRNSGGSWMLGGFISINAVASDSSIVPIAIKEFVDPKLNLSSVGFANIGVSFGYSHLFVIRKKWFVSFTFLPGLSQQKVVQTSSIDSTTTEYNSLSLRNISRFSIGYNAEHYYWGISSYVESSLVQQGKSQLFLNSGYTNVFFGYRLDTTNWHFMKKVDRILHPRFMRFITGDPPTRE